MTTFFTTETVDESSRLEYWREIVRQAFVPLECCRVSEGRFNCFAETAQLGRLRFSRVRSGAHEVERTPAHIRQATEATLLVSLQIMGTGLLLQDGREAVLKPGAITCYESVRPFSWVCHEKFEQLVLLIPREDIVGKSGQLERLTARVIGGDSAIGTLVSGFLLRAFPLVNQVSPATAQNLSRIASDLIVTALCELNGDQPAQRWNRTALLGRAKQVINDNLCDPDLRPETVAQILKISLRYLQDLFKDENTTPSSWIWSRRIEECRRRLGNPLFAGAAVSQIAFDCGFSDFSHFSHRFKAAFSVSPSDYRTSVGRAEFAHKVAASKH
jgi:AraC-like DNA-binding protein